MFTKLSKQIEKQMPFGNQAMTGFISGESLTQQERKIIMTEENDTE